MPRFESGCRFQSRPCRENGFSHRPRTAVRSTRPLRKGADGGMSQEAAIGWFAFPFRIDDNCAPDAVSATASPRPFGRRVSPMAASRTFGRRSIRGGADAAHCSRVLYLLVAIAFLAISLATSDPGVLVRPAAFAAALVWPLVVVVVIVLSLASRTTGLRIGEVMCRKVETSSPETSTS